MQLIRTSFNLRSDLPWNMVYSECIRAWIASFKDRQGRKVYDKLLGKLPQAIDFERVPANKFEFAGDRLEYDSFRWERCDYIGFTFVARNSISGRLWKTQIALKRTEKHVLCFVSQDCDLGRDKSVPKIERPFIIDLLAKFQDGDGAIEIKKQAHILEPREIDKAKNALTGRLRNVLPIVYLSCSMRTLPLKPAIVAENLFGVAHVFAEKDSSISDRLAQELKGRVIPQGGAIGICFANEPVLVFNRRDVVDWVENPEILVQDIFLKILKANLSLKFNFTWDDLLSAREAYEEDLVERERILKIETLNDMRREWLQAREERKDMSRLMEKMMVDLEKVTKERDQYKDEHAKYDSLKRKYDSCQEERKTWESLALEADEKREKAEKNLTEAKELLHEATATSNALRQNLDSKATKNSRYLPLLLPQETEMYPNEYVCQLVRILTIAQPNIPLAEDSPRTRTKDIIESILAANEDAVKTFKDYEGKKTELEKIARQAGVHSRDGYKVMKPFDMETIPKGNDHWKIRFKKDARERYLCTEASTGSDNARGRGGKNEAADITKALLW